MSIVATSVTRFVIDRLALPVKTAVINA